jgi:hypothetical protein
MHDIDPMKSLWQAMGRTSPPRTISQEAFDRDDGHLKRLAGLRPGDRAEAQDLWDYTQDLRYTDIQRPLLAYLLPFCLQAWRDDLHGARGYGGFVEHFYPVLADRHIFDEHLTAEQSAAISEFLRQSILEEIDAQRGLRYEGARARPYRWIGALNAYGVLLPDVELLWKAWWFIETIGSAVAVLQYVSALMYADDANPIFAPYTREGGGGPPCLWEYEGHLYVHRWLEPNVTFLKQALTPSTVEDVMKAAVVRLAGEAEHELAELLHEDLPGRATMLQARCAELPTLLETTQKPGEFPSWSCNDGSVPDPDR